MCLNLSLQYGKKLSPRATKVLGTLSKKIHLYNDNEYQVNQATKISLELLVV